MAKLLVDANVFIAAMNPAEIHCKRAREIISAADEVVITELVANETVNVIIRRQNKDLAVRSIAEITASGAQIVYLDDQTYMQTLHLFSAWKQSSFADAANIVMMRSLGITRIATFDKAFLQIPGIEVIS